LIGAGLVQYLVYFFELMACVINHIAFFLHTNEVHKYFIFVSQTVLSNKISAIALLTNVEEYTSYGEGHHIYHFLAC
jgi:hypothetical protein